jgi:hypothetical protein
MVDVQPMRIEKSIKPVAKKKQGDPSEEAIKSEQKKETTPSSEDEKMVKDLPSFADQDDEAPLLLKRFPMKITHVFDNGDVLATYTRNSMAATAIRSIQVEARIPYHALTTESQVTTDHLMDVKWRENRGDHALERNSVVWEDAYTMRLSQFDEVKPKLALQLEEKRQRLQKLRDELEQKLKNFGVERRQMAQEREKFITQRNLDQKRFEEMKKELAEQKEKLDSLGAEASEKENN